MIGDGINDALALGTAYTGIAMGGVGSDIAVVLASKGILNPIFGAIVHNCGSVFVVLNSALLLIN